MNKDIKFFENLQKNCNLFLVQPYPESKLHGESINNFFDSVLSSISLTSYKLTELMLNTTMADNSKEMKEFYFVIDAIHNLNTLKNILEKSVLPEFEEIDTINTNISLQ